MHIVFACAGVGTPLLMLIADSYHGTPEGFTLPSLPGVRCARTCPFDCRLRSPHAIAPLIAVSFDVHALASLVGCIHSALIPLSK
jgi:hypothetical protein